MFFFLVKVKVALFALESKGPINTPLFVFFFMHQVLIKFKISLLRVLSYLLGGFPWGRVRGFLYLGIFLGGEVFVRLINQPVHS